MDSEEKTLSIALEQALDRHWVLKVNSHRVTMMELRHSLAGDTCSTLLRLRS